MTLHDPIQHTKHNHILQEKPVRESSSDSSTEKVEDKRHGRKPREHRSKAQSKRRRRACIGMINDAISSADEDGSDKDEDSDHQSIRSPRTSKGRQRRYLVAAVFLDLLLTSFGALFLVLAAYARYSNQKPTLDLGYGDTLLASTKIAVTIFPIIYATIAIRLLRAVHRTTESRPGEVTNGYEALLKLLDSKSVGDACINIMKYRAFNLAGFALLFLWAFAPIGGQASLRVVTEESRTYNLTSFKSAGKSPGKSSYMRFDVPYQMINGSKYWNDNIDTVKAVFTTSVISSDKVRQSRLDPWDRLKLPFPLGSQQLVFNYTAHPDVSDRMTVPDLSTFAIAPPQWLNLSNQSNTFTPTSLIGMPITVMDPDVGDSSSLNNDYLFELGANSSFHMNDNFFLNASCENIESTADLTDVDVAFNRSWTFFSGANGLRIGTSPGVLDARSNGTEIGRRLYFQTKGTSVDERSGQNISSVRCNLTTVFVHLDVTCDTSGDESANGTSPSCNADGIEFYNNTQKRSIWTPFDDKQEVSSSFFADFINATQPRNSDFASAIERYLANPNNAFDLEATDSLRDNYDPDLFSIRLTQLLNSYYIANLAPDAIAGSDIKNVPGGYRTVETLASAQLDVLHCHNQWLAIMIISAIIMICAGLTNAFFDIKHREQLMSESSKDRFPFTWKVWKWDDRDNSD